MELSRDKINILKEYAKTHQKILKNMAYMELETKDLICKFDGHIIEVRGSRFSENQCHIFESFTACGNNIVVDIGSFQCNQEGVFELYDNWGRLI